MKRLRKFFHNYRIDTLVFSPMHNLASHIHIPILNPYGTVKVEVFMKVRSWLHKNPVD
jgi:hypothetical protein